MNPLIGLGLGVGTACVVVAAVLTAGNVLGRLVVHAVTGHAEERAEARLSAPAPVVDDDGAAAGREDPDADDLLLALDGQFSPAEQVRARCTYELLDTYPGRSW